MTLAVFLPIVSACSTASAENSLRAPSYPLVTIDPYTSAWSPSDELYGSTVEHWTGFPFPFVGVLTVDGQEYRFLGKEKDCDYKAIAAGAREHPWSGEYSTDGGRTWKKGRGGFGPQGRKPMTVTWVDVKEICARREIPVDADILSRNLQMLTTSKGDSEYYANGVKVVSSSDRLEIAFHPIPEEALAIAAREGRIILEGRAKTEEKGAFIDMGLYEKRTFEERFPTAAVQTSATVLPMNTIYTFTCGPVNLTLTFTAPLFLDNLELVSRPVNYVSYSVRSNDGKKHELGIRFEAGAEWAMDYAMDETAVSNTFEKNRIAYATTECTSQNPLWRSGDGVRIDWGRFYLAGASERTSAEALPDGDVALTRDLGKVSKSDGMVMVGYDDIYSIMYFREKLRPYWNADGNKTIEAEFEAALEDYADLMKKSRGFDDALMKDAAAAGGQKYAELCALAYRQAISAHKLVVSPQGDLLWLSKENNSNGSIGTVDVTYPSVPLFLLYNIDLAKGLINGIFHYSESGRWTKPFPAHDIGRYPIANGQRYGADMPVEEAGNMLILTAAICHYSDDWSYAEKHWDVLTEWTEYLLHFGLDPENQLCTDDFAGRSAHNVNLSAKAILGIASYGRMAEMLGKAEAAATYTDKAREMAAEWVRMASCGDHYKLMFDVPDSWSQKYNVVWDSLLGLGIFPDEVMDTEIPFYLTKQNRYGLPLDSRSAYTKTDWILWTATMADSKDDFAAFVAPVWDFYNETVDRIPMGDYVWSDKPEHVQFKARSVVGGIFVKLLQDKYKD